MVLKIWFLLSFMAVGFAQNYYNKEPVIGILVQRLTTDLSEHYPKYYSFVVAAYVKFLEAAGARVVPIWQVLKYI